MKRDGKSESCFDLLARMNPLQREWNLRWPGVAFELGELARMNPLQREWNPTLRLLSLTRLHLQE